MNRDRTYLHHILEAIAKIESYTAPGRETFLASSLYQDAVIRQLEIIGEATKPLSVELRTRYSDVPWRDIAGLRDVLIHDYLTVNLSRIWTITEGDMPQLRHSVEAILSEML